jgi:hypothetical protein
MSKQSNHPADIGNANKGTPGINETYQKALDNHSKHLNPNPPPVIPKPGTLKPK